MAFKPRTWRTIDRKRAGFRKAFRRVFLRALDSQIEPFLGQIKDIDVNNTVVSGVIIDNTGIERAYEQLYRTVGLEFARFERDSALKADDGFEDLFLTLIRNYIRTGVVGENIVAVGDTSKEHLQKLLSELIPEIQEMGLGTGQAQSMLRDRLKSQWHKNMRFRTERIVRTETTRASNYGSMEGIRSTGIPMWKFWVATSGIRTRLWHAEVNGQRRDLDEPFDVDGEELMFPGDTSLGASGKNVVNCRCAVTYQPKREEL